MQKRRPHYSLEQIKQRFSDPDNLGIMTASARNGARLLNFSDEDIVNAIQQMNIKNFYKSMTSYGDHTVWQDVYHTRYKNRYLYIKFTGISENNDYLLLSFKNK